VPGLATLEMETFHILHLAASWPRHAPRAPAAEPNDPPLTAAPVAALRLPPSPAPPRLQLGLDPSPHTGPGPAPAHTQPEPKAEDEDKDEEGVELELPARPPQPPLTARSPRFPPLVPNTHVRAAAAQMVFAQRASRAFIAPAEVAALEAWAGRGVLDALVGVEIDASVSVDV
jgi:uridine phosphorylase